MTVTLDEILAAGIIIIVVTMIICDFYYSRECMKRNDYFAKIIEELKEMTK